MTDVMGDTLSQTRQVSVPEFLRLLRIFEHLMNLCKIFMIQGIFSTNSVLRIICQSLLEQVM